MRGTGSKAGRTALICPSPEAHRPSVGKAGRPDTKVSGEAWRPGLPAEPRGEGAAGGGEAPADCADTGRKLASKFYQLSAEEVGAGPGSEDGCGGRGLAPHGNAPSAPKATPAPRRGQAVTPVASTPLASWASEGGGGGRRGQGQGVKVETGKLPCSLPPTHPRDREPRTSWSDPSSLAWPGQRGRFHAFQRGQTRGSDASKVTQPTKGSGPPSVPASCPHLSPGRLPSVSGGATSSATQAHAPVGSCSCGVSGAGLQPELPRCELDSALPETWGTRDPWVPRAHLTVSA